MKVSLLEETYGVCRLPSNTRIPEWTERQTKQTFLSITQTSEELSIVCPMQWIPSGVQCERDWKCIKIIGPLDFNQIGVISSMSGALAQHSIPLFVISTYDTDYLFVKEDNIVKTKQILEQNKHIFC